MAGTCPGDCCRVIMVGSDDEKATGVERLNRVAEDINLNLFGGDEWNESNALTFSILDQSAFMPEALECKHFDRGARRCGIYEKRPGMCSKFPNYSSDYACDNCTFDLRKPDEPGRRYAAIEDTGIFADDWQPEMGVRLERMGYPQVIPRSA